MVEAPAPVEAQAPAPVQEAPAPVVAVPEPVQVRPTPLNRQAQDPAPQQQIQPQVRNPN